MTTLTVWPGTEHIADLEQVRSGELRLRYLQASLDRHGFGSIALSIALPAAPRHKGLPVTRWVESKLPEGDTRTHLEDRFEVRRGDSFALRPGRLLRPAFGARSLPESGGFRPRLHLGL